MSATEDFMTILLRNVPVLAETYRQHEASYDEVLPHVLMGDIARFALHLADRSHAPLDGSYTDLGNLLLELDRGMKSGSGPVQELIAVSFLENLDETEPSFRSLALRFGPALSHEMTRLHGGDEW